MQKYITPHCIQHLFFKNSLSMDCVLVLSLLMVYEPYTYIFRYKTLLFFIEICPRPQEPSSYNSLNHVQGHKNHPHSINIAIVPIQHLQAKSFSITRLVWWFWTIPLSIKSPLRPQNVQSKTLWFEVKVYSPHSSMSKTLRASLLLKTSS